MASYKKEYQFEKEEQIIEKLKKLVTEIRNVRTNMNVHPSKKSKLILVTDNLEKELQEAKDFLSKLAFANEINFQKDLSGIDEKAISIVVEDLKAFIPFEDLVNIEEEIERLEKEKKRLEAEVLRGEKMLSNEGFINKAPQEKVEEEKKKLENYKEMLKTVEERLKTLK